MLMEVFPLALEYSPWTHDKLPYDKKIGEKIASGKTSE